MLLRSTLAGLVGGLLVTAGLAPFGWWPLPVLGIAVLLAAVGDHTRRGRIAVGLAFGIGLCLPGLWWMTEFTLPGYVLASLLESSLVALAVVACPPGRWRALGLPAGLVLVEALRWVVPFGGVPIATVAETQVGGPLLEAARIGGPLLVAALVGVSAVALGALVRRRWRLALPTALAVGAVVALAMVAPDGRRVSTIATAVVQGGGERGTRAVDSSARAVFDAHLAATDAVPEGTELVVWPEDVIDIDGDVRHSEEGDLVSARVMELGATLVAGVVAGAGDHFTNVAQVWRPDGSYGPTYEKNQRVPFGEYIPFRSLVEDVADVSAVPRDARVGRGAGLLRTRPGRLGVVISFEVFFARRARAAIRAGGELLLVPTNASSYATTQMPALELAAARLRAVETGRWVVQAAPTGFSAVIDDHGTVRRHTDLGRRQVLTDDVERRQGQTLYTRAGDLPMLALAALALLAAWLLARLRPGPSRSWLRSPTRHP